MDPFRTLNERLNNTGDVNGTYSVRTQFSTEQRWRQRTCNLPRTATRGQMSAKKIREIRVDIQEIVLTRRLRRSLYAECTACGQGVQFVSAEQAAEACNVSTRTIYRWIESRRAHFIETRERRMFICLDSLRVEDGPCRFITDQVTVPINKHRSFLVQLLSKEGRLKTLKELHERRKK